MTDDFVEKYISDCIERGICTPKDICNHVLERIDEIDKELIQQNGIRQEKTSLQAVLRTFNHESFKKPKKTKSPMINLDVEEDDLEPSYKNLLAGICEFMENQKRPVMPREIIDGMFSKCDGSVDNKQRSIYMSIKWLLDKGIVSRNDEDRSISMGKNWEKRPIL